MTGSSDALSISSDATLRVNTQPLLHTTFISALWCTAVKRHVVFLRFGLELRSGSRSHSLNSAGRGGRKSGSVLSGVSPSMGEQMAEEWLPHNLGHCVTLFSWAVVVLSCSVEKKKNEDRKVCHGFSAAPNFFICCGKLMSLMWFVNYEICRSSTYKLDGLDAASNHQFHPVDVAILLFLIMDPDFVLLFKWLYFYTHNACKLKLLIRFNKLLIALLFCQFHSFSCIVLQLQYFLTLSFFFTFFLCFFSTFITVVYYYEYCYYGDDGWLLFTYVLCVTKLNYYLLKLL